MKNKNYFFQFSALALMGLAVTFQGCGKSDKKAEPSKPAAASATAPKAPSGPVSASAEQAAIPFHNSLLRFMGASQKSFKKIAEEGKKSQEFFASDTGKPSWGHVLDSDFEKVPSLKFAAPSSFASGDKDFFNSRIKVVQDSVKQIAKLTGELNTYYAEENYKDDWHKKFLVTEPLIDALFDKISDANTEMFERSDTITEEIDRRNLAKTPLGVYILNMRYVMDKAKAQSALLLRPELRDTRVGTGVSAEEKTEMVAHAKPIAEQAEALLKELDGLVEKYKAVDRGPIKGKKFDGIYDDFFKNYAAYRTDVVRIVRELKENGYQNDQSTIRSGVSSLFRAHNSFVDTLNGK